MKISFLKKLIKNKNKEKYNLVVSFIGFSFMLWNHKEKIV